MWTCPKCGERLGDQFDSCWKCAAKPAQTLASVQHLTWSLIVSLTVAATLAPMLADGLQSLVVFERAYQTAFSWYLNSTASACLFIGVRTAITFLILLYFAKHGFRGRIIWVFMTILWLWADFALEPSLRK
jgi:hypothetical protein